MVKVLYSQDDEYYTSLEVKGHAEFEDKGKDIICASVSSIIFGLMNALDELNEDVEIQELANKIVIINNSKSNEVNDYFKLAMFQLKTIEESYGKFIKVERK